uniref:NACHT domain-containing protein n=1 Tax=Amphimedon queenslandica TaxID=400682 RepID=A0A1X7T8H4_AMPQE
MIDICQWRASIGLWNYCQAASSRPANGRHSHSFKAAVDSKSGSTTSGEKTSKLPAAFFLIAFLLFFSLLRHIFMIPPTGNCYQVQCTPDVTVTDTNYLQSVVLPGGSSSNLIYNDLYLIVCLRMLLLLSGDVELNPGPTTDKELNIAAVMNIFNTSAQHYKTIGGGLQVYIADLLERQDPDKLKLRIIFQRWFDAGRDVNWGALERLCQSDVAKPISSIPDDVQGYADNMRQHYKHQPIVATDWPPRIGKDFVGRLALVEKQDSSTQAESAWHMLRGQVDKIVKLTGNKEISVEDVLQATGSSLSLRVVIDGPPGIGKTTLCLKLLYMWSNGTLVHQQYDLVLYCPLRNSKITTATTLADLFVRQHYEVPMVAEWFEKRDGEGLLIIFDGWEDLSEELRRSSLAARIICKEELDQCSVIVTSRNYASASLLKMDTLSRHVQVIGFSEEEISTVIIQTLQKDTKLAQELIDKKKEDDTNHKPFTTTQSSKDSQLAVKLINDLEVRNVIQKLCYVPLVCSMVILVYCHSEENQELFSEETTENLQLFSIETQEDLKHALKESRSIKYKVRVAIIQGEARVGKACIKSLILKMPYSKVSTSLIEAPCMAFGSFSVNRYGRTDDNRWTRVTDDDLDGIVVAELKKIASGLKIPNEMIQSPTAAKRTLEQSDRDIGAMSYASDNVNPTPTSSEAALTSNAVQDLNTEDSAMPLVNLPVEDIDEPIPVHEEKMDVKVPFEYGLQKFDVLKYLKENHRTSEAGFERDWLYFFDSGGQIQFQKLLLAFMPCSSILVLVVNLSKNLSDPSSTLMQLSNDTIDYNEYSLQVDDMLRQIISAVDSNTKQFRSMMEGQQRIKPPENEKLQVITIGTHRDIYNKRGKGTEDIQAKRVTLKSILQSESIQIAYTADDDLIHEVDGRKAERSEFDDDPVIETISKALNEQAYEIEVPFKWHYFGVILRNEAKENEGILKLSSCIEFGKILAKDIVFVKLDAVINIIKELMIKVCKDMNKLEVGPDVVAQLAKKGYLSIKVLEKNAGALKGNERILLGLFVHLKIAALIPTDENKRDFTNGIGTEETDVNIAASEKISGTMKQKHVLSGDKELNLDAVTRIFGSSAHHYMLIGNGLGVRTADLMPIPGTADINSRYVFQRWFEANRNISWNTLIKLCDNYPDELGKAKSELLKYI